jgi:heme/copper-type cytochrome/quinol oxidase subunit 4
MTNKMKKILGIGLTAIALAMIADTAMAADDTQVWTTLGASAEITPGITLNLEEQFRLSDEADLLRQHTDLSVTLGAVANRMTVTLGYRNTSDDEQRPYIGADLRILSNKLTLDSVTRLEMRSFDGDNSFRGRTAVVAGTTVAGLDLTLSDELYVTVDGVEENRATLGVGYDLNEVLGVNAFYMLWTTGLDTESTNSHVVGLGAALSL